ncbi:MAG: 50S ribosomal protein L15 [Planctomycetota bacterium]|nr:MAG: 50S ribosomal protein L15 [Planctomycetota bacterium]
MIIDQVNRGITKNRKRRRVGRGPGSGRGKTSSRGHKGQGSRSGTSTQAVFEGAMMPLVRRIPKRGFNNPFAKDVMTVNVGDLDAIFESGDEITPDTLRASGLIRGRFDVLKILGDGDLSKKLKISAHKFSKSAQEKIEKAGGQITLLSGPKPVVKNQKKQK